MPRRATVLVLLLPMWMLPLLALLLTTNVPAQTVAPSQAAASDPQAVALANQAVLALTRGVPITDAMLTGTAIRIVASDQQSGGVTLKVKGTGESRIDLAISSKFCEVRNDAVGPGFWYGKDQTWHPMALHNALTDAAWFFPALSSLSVVNNPNTTSTYIGLETREGIAVQHVRISRQVSNVAPRSAAFFSHLNTVDFYLDVRSLLPAFIAFAVHPDDDAGIDIPAEIRFADYRNVNGVQVPFRIQKLVQGSLLLDLAISQAAINTGIQDADFVVTQ